MLGKGVGNTELLMVKWVFPEGGSNFLKACRKMIFPAVFLTGVIQLSTIGPVTSTKSSVISHVLVLST